MVWAKLYSVRIANGNLFRDLFASEWLVQAKKVAEGVRFERPVRIGCRSYRDVTKL